MRMSRLFCHSLLSDWNHGNAHFLRGVVTELRRARPRRRGLRAARRAGALPNLRRRPRRARRSPASAAPIPRSRSQPLRPRRRSTSTRRSTAPTWCIVHEWNDHELVRAHRRAPRARRRATGCSSTTPTTAAVTDAARDGRLRPVATTTACSRSASVIRDLYLARGWAQRAWTWHEAADTRVFRPHRRTRRAQATSSGSATGATTSAPRELREFLIEPVARARPHGARPRRALSRAGARRRSRARGHRVRRLAAQLEVPRGLRPLPRHRARAAAPVRRGAARHPDDPRRSRRWPAASRWSRAPWDDAEGLFRRATTSSSRATATRCARTCARCSHDPELRRASSPRTGCETILARHTCAHRVDELLAIVAELGSRREPTPGSDCA